MKIITTREPLRLVLALATVAIGLSDAFAQKEAATIPDDASEAYLIDRIRRYSEATPEDLELGQDQRLLLQTVAEQQILEHVDALVARYPDSSFKEEAQIIKLNSLANLARLHSGYLQLLISFTEEIARDKPKGRLASENAFAAIRAFVMAARYEEMPEERLRLGTLERYEAFIEDYPKSERIPAIRASLIRTLIVQDRLDRARAEFAILERDYPDHRATRRARGELNRATAVGKPFAFAHATPDGTMIRTEDYLGKVVLVHFWAAWSEPAIATLPAMIELNNRYAERGLQLIGVNVDADRRSMEEVLDKHPMPWPLYFDEKGFENEAFIQMGVRKLPAFFVIDHKGILRSIDPGASLEELVRKLLDELPPKQKTEQPAEGKKQP